MNRTSIEWCNFTWNPVSGCLHPCRSTYCYNVKKATSPLNRFGAQYLVGKNGKSHIERERNYHQREDGTCHVAQQGEIYPYGYDPTLYPHRLYEPSKVGAPNDISNGPQHRIFVVDGGDLWGNWVPTKWIAQVLGVVAACPWHAFLFLTKNPGRYAEFALPWNSWIGASISSDADGKRVRELRGADDPSIRYLSIEPILGPVTVSLDGIDWVILGADSRPGAKVPELSWVKGVVRQAAQRKISVFIKDNLVRHYPKELPAPAYKNFPM